MLDFSISSVGVKKKQQMDLHLLLFGYIAPSLLCPAYAALVRYSREMLPGLIQGNV